MNRHRPGPQAAEELWLGARFPGSLRTGNTPAALSRLTALHDLRQLATGNGPEADR